MKIAVIIDSFLKRETKEIFAVPISRREESVLPAPEQCYFDLRLELMNLAANRRLLVEYHPVLTGNVSFGALGSQITTTTLITPEIPGHEEKSRLNRVFLRGQELVPLQVYRGGDIDVALGLYSTPGDDWAKQFLGFAKAVSDVAGVSPLSTAVAVAEPLKVAFDALLSRGNVAIELGIKLDLLRAGLKENNHFVLVGTPQELQKEYLSFDGTDVHYRGRPLQNADVILISLSFLKARPDLYTLPVALSAQKTLKSIAELYIKTGGSAEAEGELYRRFAAEAMLHDQLTMGDKARLIHETKAAIEELRKTLQESPMPSRSGGIAEHADPLTMVDAELFKLKQTDAPVPAQMSMGEAMLL